MKGKRLTFNQKRWLVHLYLNGGYEASKPYAIKCGITPRYVAQLVGRCGHKATNRLKWLSMHDPKRAREIYWPWVKHKNPSPYPAPNPTKFSTTRPAGDLQ